MDFVKPRIDVRVPSVQLAGSQALTSLPGRGRAGRAIWGMILWITSPAAAMPDLLFYEILEVHPKARTAVIKAAYRCLVQECHPDKNPQDSEAAARMTLINHAFAVLGDPVRRKRYDEKLAQQAAERRGSGASSSSAKQAPERAKSRPFAFRPLK